MHLPIAQLFYAASALFLIAAVFSTVLALLYRVRFGAQHANDAATSVRYPATLKHAAAGREDVPE